VTENDDHDAPGPGKFGHLGQMHMAKVEHLLEKSEYVGSSDLVAALREHAGKPVPNKVLDYLCRYLEGEVSSPVGKPGVPEFRKYQKGMIMRGWYNFYLPWLQARNKRYGHLDGWSILRGEKSKDWWRGPPHERAARMVAYKFGYGAGHWRRVKNMISSHKPPTL